MGCFASTPEAVQPSSQANKDPAATTTPAAAVPPQQQPAQASVVLGSVTRPLVKVTERDKAVLKLKSHRDELEMSLTRVEAMVKEDDEHIRNCLREGRREHAKLLLRRKAIALKREKIAIQSLNSVESMIDTLETQDQTLVFMEALKESTKAIKSLNQVLTVEDMDDAVGKYKDEAAYAARVQDVLYSTATPEEVDPEEVNRLVAMAEEDLGTNETAPLDPNKGAETGDQDADVLAALQSAEPTPSSVPNVTAEQAATAAAARTAAASKSKTLTSPPSVKQPKAKVPVGA
jgi:Snf7